MRHPLTLTGLGTFSAGALLLLADFYPYTAFGYVGGMSLLAVGALLAAAGNDRSAGDE